MSDGLGFGYYTGDGPQDDLNAQQQGAGDGQQKSGLRQYLDRLEAQNKTLTEQVNSLMSQQKRNTVADVLESKGYDRAAAALYTGEPDKVEEWLTANGSLLAKRPDSGDSGQSQGGTGTASETQAGAGTTISPEDQAKLQQVQQMGQNAAAPAGSDAEQAAAIAAISDPQKLTEYLAGQGNAFAQLWNG